MTTHHSEKDGPREPHNIPIRIYGTGISKEEEAERRALLRDIRALIDDAFRRGVLQTESWKKSKRARELKARVDKMDWRALIEVDSSIKDGDPVIKGTQLSVRSVLTYLGFGDTVAGICRRYRVSKTAVHAALSYAAWVLSKRSVIDILIEDAGNKSRG